MWTNCKLRNWFELIVNSIIWKANLIFLVLQKQCICFHLPLVPFRRRCRFKDLTESASNLIPKLKLCRILINSLACVRKYGWIVGQIQRSIPANIGFNPIFASTKSFWQYQFWFMLHLKPQFRLFDVAFICCAKTRVIVYATLAAVIRNMNKVFKLLRSLWFLNYIQLFQFRLWLNWCLTLWLLGNS